MPYKILVYIPIEDEDNIQIYETMEEVTSEIDNLNLMQPENIYVSIEIEEK